MKFKILILALSIVSQVQAQETSKTETTVSQNTQNLGISAASTYFGVSVFRLANTRDRQSLLENSPRNLYINHHQNGERLTAREYDFLIQSLREGDKITLQMIDAQGNSVLKTITVSEKLADGRVTDSHIDKNKVKQAQLQFINPTQSEAMKIRAISLHRASEIDSIQRTKLGTHTLRLTGVAAFGFALKKTAEALASTNNEADSSIED